MHQLKVMIQSNWPCQHKIDHGKCAVTSYSDAELKSRTSSDYNGGSGESVYGPLLKVLSYRIIGVFGRRIFAVILLFRLIRSILTSLYS